MLACAAIIAVASLMTAATLSVGIAYAQFQPPGPPGPPFSNQVLQVREVESPILTVVPGGSQSVTASCDPDEVLTGGGFGVEEFDPDNNVVNYDLSSTRLGSSQIWEVILSNNGPDPMQVRAVAECLKLIPS